MLLLGGGTSFGASEGQTPPFASVPAPVLGQSEIVALVSGSVRVRIAGSATFTPLPGVISVPDDSEIDASRGRVTIEVATSGGGTDSADAYQGRFVLHQDPTAPAEAHLLLSQPIVGCATHPHRRRARAGTARHKASHRRQVWVSEHGGHWATGGKDVTTTVEGTRWLTIDECHRSRVVVAEGKVLVHDLVLDRVATVSAGHEYVAAVEGRAFLPASGEVLTGQSGGSSTTFQQEVGKHPAVYGYFASWGQPMATPLSYAEGSKARLLVHLSTDVGYGGGAGESISPGGIASGGGDGYLVQACRELALSSEPVYVALLPEMNQTNNAYSAFGASGSPRPGHSTATFRQAWRRAVLIMRGGPVAHIDTRLAALHLPPVHTSAAKLPRPRIAFMWAPQTAGTPDTPGNAPSAYYPGDEYVDIVGTDFYSAFPNFDGLARLYSEYPSKPFAFNEWAMWRNGDPGFIRTLFAFIRGHGRFGLIAYNQGLREGGPFRLSRFPAAARALRREMRSPRFLGYAPGITGPSGQG